MHKDVLQIIKQLTSYERRV